MVDYYVGEVKLFVGSYAPQGWHFCNGSMLAINTYQTLFSLIGTTYGGDGVTTFGIPDLRGRVPISMGTGPGMTPRVVGQSGGAEYVGLDIAKMPAHRHAVNTAGFNATTTGASSTVAWGNTAAPTYQFMKDSAPAASFVDVSMVEGTISNDGSSQMHSNVMPYVALNYIIALNGIYPTRP